jgi:hypothetical protein
MAGVFEFADLEGRQGKADNRGRIPKEYTQVLHRLGN